MKLAFWTRRDAARMDRLFRQSGLMRPKWLRDDYRTRTIETATQSTSVDARPDRHRMSVAAVASERLPQGRSTQPKFSIADIPSVWGYQAHVTWLVENLIPEGCITLLSGDSGVGKSTLRLALAGAVAHGTAFLGLPTSHRRV